MRWWCLGSAGVGTLARRRVTGGLATAGPGVYCTATSGGVHVSFSRPLLLFAMFGVVL